MTRRFSKLMMALTLATVLIVLLAPSGAQGVVAPTSGPPLGGVNAAGLSFGASSAKVAQEIAWARSLHARTIRVEIRWATLEPKPGQVNQRALAFTDGIVNQAAAAGIKVVALVLRTPCWASSAPQSLLRTCSNVGTGRANAWPPTNSETYGSFVAMLAARYGSELAAIEVWNEPDQANEDYLAGPNKAKRYAELLRAAYPAIKHVDPQMTVLGGSLVGSNGAFLRALYAAGIKGYYDGLSVHFYTLVLGSLRYLHEVQLQNGDHTPLWLNEFGWSSCWPRQRIQQEQGCVTKQAQATNIANVFRETARTPWDRRRDAVLAAGLAQRRIRRAQRNRCAQARLRCIARRFRLALWQTKPGDRVPEPPRQWHRGERLRARRRLPAAGSIQRRTRRLQGTVHARPLQPLRDRLADACSRRSYG